MQTYQIQFYIQEDSEEFINEAAIQEISWRDLSHDKNRQLASQLVNKFSFLQREEYIDDNNIDSSENTISFSDTTLSVKDDPYHRSQILEDGTTVVERDRYISLVDKDSEYEIEIVFRDDQSGQILIYYQNKKQLAQGIGRSTQYTNELKAIANINFLSQREVAENNIPGSDYSSLGSSTIKTYREARIIDIPKKHVHGFFVALGSTLLFYLMFIVVVIVVIAFGINFGGGSILFAIVLSLLTSMLLGIIPSIQKKRSTRRVKKIIDQHGIEDVEKLLVLINQKKFTFAGERPFAYLVEVLSIAGVNGLIIRNCLSGASIDIKPIKFPFEPRKIDESEQNFKELYESVSHGGGDQDESYEAVDNPKKIKFTNPVIRNIQLKEGYFSLVVFSLLWLWSAYDSYQAGKLITRFYIWSILLLMKLFWPVSGTITSENFYMIPRALIWEKTVNKDQGIFIYDRMKSNVLVTQLKKKKWKVYVFSSMFKLEFIATPREVEMFLRAWNSDLVPPPYEEISQLFN